MTWPLANGTWTDLEQLFDLPGGSIVRGCWCMFHRRTGKRDEAAGFHQAVRRSPTRVVMRLALSTAPAPVTA